MESIGQVGHHPSRNPTPVTGRGMDRLADDRHDLDRPGQAGPDRQCPGTSADAHGNEGDAEPGRENEFIYVLISGGPGRDQAEKDYSHAGFAMESRAAVDAIAAKAKAAGCLIWEPREEPYPVGYYCGVRDPDGNAVEFSYGQPLGPGAEPI